MGLREAVVLVGQPNVERRIADRVAALNPLRGDKAGSGKFGAVVHGTSPEHTGDRYYWGL